MNYTNKLDIESLKQDEKAFRELIGNTPARFGVKFKPNGLDGNSWTFFKSDINTYLLQRKSSSEVLDIVGYAKAIGLSIEDLKTRFPHYVQEGKPNETLEIWLSNHCLTRAEVEAKSWRINEYEAAYPIETDKGVLFHKRKFGAEHKQRFHSEKGLKTGTYFYTPSKLKSTPRLIICAGAADCLNVHLAFAGEIDCIGIIGETTVPSELLKLQYDEYVIAYDNDEAGRKGTLKLASKFKNVKVPNWSLFPGIKDLSELAAKQGRESIVQLIEGAIGFQEDNIEIEAEFNNLSELPERLDPREIFSGQLPEALKQAADTVQVPVEHLITLLWPVLASCVGDICFKSTEGYLQPSVIFSMSLARSGSNKTWMQSLITNALREIHKQEKKKFEEAKKLYEQALKIAKNEDLECLEEEPVQYSFIANGGSTEGSGSGGYKNFNGGFLIANSEAEDFIRGLGKYSSSGNSNDQVFWNIAWDGGDYSQVRVKEIRNSFDMRISVCLSGHPDKSIEAFKEIAKEEISEDPRGFLARWLICAIPCELPELVIDAKPLLIRTLLQSLINGLLKKKWGIEE